MGSLKESLFVLPALLLLTGLGALRPDPVAAQVLRFTRLTTEDGIAHDTVHCILQDDQGFLWFGTQNGLNRYDGYTFTVYRHRYADPTSLADSTVTAVYQDSAGLLWVGTVVGLDSLDRATGQFHHHLSVSESVSIVLEDNAGNLWIGSHGGGLFRLDRANGEAVQYRHDPASAGTLSDDNVTAIHQDSEGTLWVGTWNGLNALDPITGQINRYHADPDDPASLSHDWVTAILEERTGAPATGSRPVLWVGTGSDDTPEVGGLNRLEVATGRFTRYLHDPDDRHSLGHNQVTALYQDRDGALWVGTEAGLDLWEPAGGRFVHHAHDPLDLHSLGRGRVSVISQDRSGTLWFATRDGGVSAYATAKDRFARYQPDPLDPDSLSGASIGALYLDHEGILWIGVRGGGLNRLDRATGQYTHYLHDPNDPDSLGADTVTALLEDREGVLWVGTSDGLDRLVLSRFQGPDGDGAQFTHYVHDPADPNSLCPGPVKVIAEDRDGVLWVGTEEPGTLGRFSRADESFFCYQHDPADPDGWPDTYGVRALYPDRMGDASTGSGAALWLGTYDGLIRLDPATGTLRRYLHDPVDPSSLIHDFVWSLYQDRAGALWIGTHGGLHRLDPTSGQLTLYTTEDGLPNDAVSAIYQDGQGALWLGTIGGGVSRFDPASGAIRNYDVSDGLPSNSVLIGAHHQSADGEIFLGGPNGFTAFFPADIRDNPTLPPVRLTAFRKFDQVVEFDTDLAELEYITLTYRDNFFALEFAALDFTDPSKNQYAYQLEGFDQDWIYCGTRRYAGYTNVPPGEYTFHVKGSNNDGIWNEAGQSVRIVVAPAFWQTGWFRLLALALVLGVVAVIIRRRLQWVAVLRESEERFRALFESAPLSVLELDVGQSPPQVLRANQRSENLFGWPAAELETVGAERILAAPALEWTANSLRAGQTATTESTGLRRDGGEFPVRICATREPRWGRVILVLEDITAERERRSEEEAIAEERRRIAREIHDGLAQDLAGLRLQVPFWHKLVDEAPARMHAELDGLHTLLGEQIRQARRSIFALRPVELDEQGFWPALRQFVREFGEQYQLHVDLRIDGPTEWLPAYLELALFRVIQESLNNVGKHAQAGMVWIELDLQSGTALTLRVRDDGVGFDPATLSDAGLPGHFGLKQIRERVEYLHGDFCLHTRPGGGTEIAVVLPVGTSKT